MRRSRAPRPMPMMVCTVQDDSHLGGDWTSMGISDPARTERRQAPSPGTCETHITALGSPCHLRDQTERDSSGITVPWTLRQTCFSGPLLMGLGLRDLMLVLMAFGIIQGCLIRISLCDEGGACHCCYTCRRPTCTLVRFILPRNLEPTIIIYTLEHQYATTIPFHLCTIHRLARNIHNFALSPFTCIRIIRIIVD